MQTDVIAVKQAQYFPCGMCWALYLVEVCELKRAVHGKAGEIRTRSLLLVELGGALFALLSTSLNFALCLPFSLWNSQVDDVCHKHFIDEREKSVRRRRIKPFVDFAFCNHFPLDLCSKITSSTIPRCRCPFFHFSSVEYLQKTFERPTSFHSCDDHCVAIVYNSMIIIL